MADRIDQLETQRAFQGEAINQLNEEVTRRGKEVETLRQEFEYLEQKYQEIRLWVVRPEDQGIPPPHY